MASLRLREILALDTLINRYLEDCDIWGMVAGSETAFILRRWLRVREGVNRRKETALFLSTWGHRISRNDVYRAVTEAAQRVGLHNPESERLEDHFSPHACRHWFCTHLFRAGMRREFIKELRGDARKEASFFYRFR